MDSQTATAANSSLAERLKSRFPSAGLQAIIDTKGIGEDTFLVAAPSIVDIMTEVQKEFPLIVDICGVDYPNRSKRFDVVYHVYNYEQNRRLRVKTQASETESVPSIIKVYRGADWFEREAFDMYGIQFLGHPNLRRLLTHEDFEGHPLRKDYPADRNQELRTPLEHTFAKDKERLGFKEGDHLSDRVWLNIGPAHPSTHGTLRMMAVMSGETIEKLDLEIGYLHRCFEKMCETHNYNQVIPYTDRLNYCSAPLNNNAWCRTIEKLMGITVPARAQVIRMILDEFSRIIDHFVCVATNAVDLGALTNFWLAFNAREAVYDLFEKLCGARLTVSLARIGGLGFDLPDGWVDLARNALKVIETSHSDLDLLLTKNRIFVSRMTGVTPCSRADALNWGFTGPALRAAGEPYDVRVAAPYDMYSQVEFDIPVGHTGDCYDRYMIRMEEIKQSVRIIRQLLDQIPSGPIAVEDPRITLPKKQDVYGNIEGLMNQFMLIVHGVCPPAGEVYCASEGANGELGFYVVSDGSGRPYRVKCRPPCFPVLQAFPSQIEGHLLADAIAGVGTINFIAGELDR